MLICFKRSHFIAAVAPFISLFVCKRGARKHESNRLGTQSGYKGRAEATEGPREVKKRSDE